MGGGGGVKAPIRAPTALHSHFCTGNYKGNSHLFIMATIAAKLFAAVKKCIAAKEPKIKVFRYQPQGFHSNSKHV